MSITVDYPNELQPRGQGPRQDRRSARTPTATACADKVTVFADKLSIPTSLLPYAGGVIVHQAPHTLFLKDTDGDGKADVRQVLFTGWGTGDTHAGPSNLHYGLRQLDLRDRRLRRLRGTVGGERHSFRQGFYRFKSTRRRIR